MELEIAASFKELRSLLHAGLIRGNEVEERFNRRMEKAEKRMEKAERRMDKFDRRQEATLKLIQAGMKLLFKEQQERKAVAAEIRELARSQNVFIDSLTKGPNGFHREA